MDTFFVTVQFLYLYYYYYIYLFIIIIIIFFKFLTSQLWLGNIHLSWDVVINRIRLGGLTCSFLLVWLGPVLLLKSPLFRQTNPRLSAICSTLVCLHIVGWGHTDGGRARLFGTIVSWLCYYILHQWGVHLHLRGLSPVVCTYHLLLLLQHEETTWPVCLRSMSEGASPVYHVVELYQLILCHPYYYYYYYYY